MNDWGQKKQQLAHVEEGNVHIVSFRFLDKISWNEVCGISFCRWEGGVGGLDI